MTIQEAYVNIFDRQKQVTSLKTTKDGICSYIGEITLFFEFNVDSGL